MSSIQVSEQISFAVDDENHMNLEIYDISLQHWVAKANPLVEAHYKLTAIEQKVLMILASKVQPQDQSLKPYKFRVMDFSDIIGAKKSTSIYSYFREVVTGLQRKTLSFKRGSKVVVANWLMTSIYEDSEGTVVLKFNPDLKEFFLHLKEKFISYQLQNIVRLKSAYSIRIYELLKQYETIKRRTFTVEEFRELVGLEKDTYPQYGHLKSRVLNPAQKEVAEKTDIEFTYEEMKKGKKVVKLVFTIKSKKVDKIFDEIPPTIGDGEESKNKSKPYLNDEEQDRDKVREELIGIFELKQKEVANLFKKYDIERIKQAIEYTKNYTKPIDNLNGFIQIAIKENWANNPFPPSKGASHKKEPIRKEITPENIIKGDEEEKILKGDDLEAKRKLYEEKHQDFENDLIKAYTTKLKLAKYNKDLNEEEKEKEARNLVSESLLHDVQDRLSLELPLRTITSFKDKMIKDLYRPIKNHVK